MIESEVKKLVKEWLLGEFNRGFVRDEFLVEGRRIDFLAARWTDEGRQLDVVGVECKGEITPAALSVIVADQLSHYARRTPKVYLACSMPGEPRLQEIRTFCRVAGVGLIACGFSGRAVDDPPTKTTLRLDREQYLKDVRCRVAMFLAFERKFRGELGMGIHPAGGRIDWISTDQPLDRPQWNSFINPDDPHCFLGVNFDNANRLFRTTDLADLSNSMARLPIEARCEVQRVQFLGRGQRTWLPIRRAGAHIIADELLGVASLVDTLGKGESLSFTVGFPLWRSNEAFSQRVHQRQLEEAYEVLKPLWSSVGGEALD